MKTMRENVKLRGESVEWNVSKQFMRVSMYLAKNRNVRFYINFVLSKSRNVFMAFRRDGTSTSSTSTKHVIPGTS